MKKTILYTLIAGTTLFYTSCNQELDNWYSATSGLDGRYVVAATCVEYSDDDTAIEDGHELMIYNTASNAVDEIWIDTEIAGLPIKGKVKFSGSSESFKGAEQSKNIKKKYYYIVGGKLSATLAAPTSAGLTNPGYDLYSRITLEEGKILPKAATSIGGNQTDSAYVKLVLHTDEIVFESYQLPEKDWAVPGTPSFAWRIKDGSRTPADDWDEHWTVSGYRFTGFPEDL